MVDYHNLSKSFLDIALQKDSFKAKFNEEVKEIKKTSEGYTIKSKKGEILSDSVLVTAGAYSLFFAKKLGYGNNLGVLSVGGKFYYSKKVLNGKVYRVEREGIPFAAVHGDPDITDPTITRFGPTVNIYPELEKGNLYSMPDYFHSLNFNEATAKSLENILFDRTISKIVKENLVYSIPFIGKISFTKK